MSNVFQVIVYFAMVMLAYVLGVNMNMGFLEVLVFYVMILNVMCVF